MPVRTQDRLPIGTDLVINDFDQWSFPTDAGFVPPSGPTWFGPDPEPVQ